MLHELNFASTVFASDEEERLAIVALKKLESVTEQVPEFKNPIFRYSVEALVVNTVKILHRLESSGSDDTIICDLHNALKILLMPLGIVAVSDFHVIMDKFCQIYADTEELREDNKSIAEFMCLTYASERCHLFYGNPVLMNMAQKCAISAFSGLDEIGQDVDEEE